MRAVTVLGLVGAGLLLPVQGAMAGTGATAYVGDDGAFVYYMPASGQANDVKISAVAAASGDGVWEYTIDDVVPITPGKDCVRPPTGT